MPGASVSERGKVAEVRIRAEAVYKRPEYHADRWFIYLKDDKGPSQISGP